MSVRVTVEGAVAFVRFERPSPSFASLALLAALWRALARLERDPAVRVIVICNARDGEFLAHLEIEEFEAMLTAARRIPSLLIAPALVLLRAAVALLARWPGLADRLLPEADPRALRRMASVVQLCAFDALERSSKITVAAIEGPCIGCGLELALACDLRVASDRPDVILGLPEARVGMVPGFGGTQRLGRAVPPGMAAAMLLRGELIAAGRAHRIGLVHELLPASDFTPALGALLHPLARRSPESVRAIRRAAVTALPSRSGLFEELHLVAKLARSDALTRAMREYRAFLDDQLARMDEPGAFAAAVAAMDEAESEA